jgi:EAL domain-containing protein (putative c-di-GMP-specific phosphodiesterase class I)
MTYGYLYAEKIIKEIAEVLSKLCLDRYQLFHISIERFAILVNEYHDYADLSKLCEIIIKCTTNIHHSNNVQTSIGIVELDDNKISVDNILKFAFIAAEQAIKNKAVEYCFYNQEMENKILRKEMIKEELATAIINNKEIFLMYQPIVDLKTDKIYAFEALVRFNNEKLGFVSPVEFIPIAEETGLIISLGKRIMQYAFGYLKELEEHGYNDIIMSFNVSSLQLLREDFILILVEIINDTKINPANLIIELTESVFSSDFQEINVKLNQIKELGIKVSIDDFGTGYSSLARERELNINCLKIDKYFIDKLLIVGEKEAITGDIISMAHKLGHYVVAEGVEYEEQKKYLIEHNCDYLQGYLFSKPLSPEAAMELLERTN